MDGETEGGMRGQVCLGGPYKAWMSGELWGDSRGRAEIYTCRDREQEEPNAWVYFTNFLSHSLRVKWDHGELHLDGIHALRLLQTALHT